MKEIIDKLYQTRNLSDEQFAQLIDIEDDQYLFEQAMARRREYYGDDIYVRGLIEVSNYCRNNCYYCGLRSENKGICRYRLSEEQILACCEEGYALGFRTFVLQGGEDAWFDDERLCHIVRSICRDYEDCVVTLSLGERSAESYLSLYQAGARRYLLRHETALDAHYRQLHPESMSLENRKQCLRELKKIGFQTGSGFMVGSPGQSLDNLVADLRFLQELQPEMIGIGPFLPQSSTPFADCPPGRLDRTIHLIAILRLMFPNALIPSTTALATLDKNGRNLGLLAGANVVMPNLSPNEVRDLYAIYDNKAHSGCEAAQTLNLLAEQVERIGFRIVVHLGNVKPLHLD